METQMHDEDQSGNVLSTNKPVQRQFSSSVKSEERVDESSALRSRKNRARSSVVWSPSVGTSDPEGI